MNRKSIITILLSLAVIFTYIPEAAFARDTVAEADIAYNEDLLEGYFGAQVDKIIGNSKPVFRAVLNTRRNMLNPSEQQIYDVILEMMESVAAGEKTSAEVSINLSEALSDYLTDADGFKAIVSDSIDENAVYVKQVIDGEDCWDFSEEAKHYLYDIDKTVDAVLFDNPYPAYWFDKIAGYDYFLNALTDTNTDVSDIYFEDEPVLLMSFTVAEGYRAENDTSVDADKTKGTAAAVENAARIIKENAAKKPVEKLISYKNVICDMTSFDYEAADESVPYGDPWQLIWVFDGNDETRVVCEGYSKAFQFLCDRSDLDAAGIECNTVTGALYVGTHAEGHMWNILHMEDDKNYIADITNCDGDDDPGVYTYDLFLKGCDSGSVETGYVYAGGIRYGYDEATRNLYADSELLMSGTDYSNMPEDSEPAYVAAKKPSCEKKGNKAYWIKDGRYYEDEACTRETTIEALTLNALGHSWGAWMVTKKASLKAEGILTRVCNNDASHKETKAIPKNNMTAKAKKKTFYAKSKTKTTIKAAKAYTVKNAKGKLTYSKVKGNSKITVAKNGKITVKKGLKKGKTYTLKVKVISAATKKYKKATKTVTLRIKIK